MNASEAAASVLTDGAHAEFNATVERALAAGFRWIWDPEHDDVVGLVAPGNSKRAYVVVYVAEDDFEGDDLQLEEAVNGLEA